MKYIVILGDGMSDYPISELGGKTPLQCAKKPNIDSIVKTAEVGMVKTVPESVLPGSDTANLSVLGYDPERYYSGRSPLEAVSMGVWMSESDVSFRCNLVTLSDDEFYENKIMIDYSSDEISSEEASLLIDEINKHFESDNVKYYAGKSYRHCMIKKNGSLNLDLIPPHDILEKKIKDFLPKGEINKEILDMMVKSNQLLKEHPVNQKRIARGLKPANSIWLWGEGKKPSIPNFYDKYHVKGSVISAVDLIKGIGICAGLNSVEVENATGNIHTNFIGKAKAALKELEEGKDFVYVHIEAPDECGHRYEIENKVRSIEIIDEQVVGTLLKGLEKYEDYKIMLLPDHPTPLSLRTHTKDPVPFMIYHKKDKKPLKVDSYDEIQIKEKGIYIDKGYTLMDYFLK